jgi:hypothetical protein
MTFNADAELFAASAHANGSRPAVSRVLSLFNHCFLKE